jgi:excisionase family DNA binding protein
MFNLIEALDNFERTMKTAELARLLGVSKQTVIRMADDKVIPVIFLRGHRRFCPSAVKKWYLKQNPSLAR